MGYMPHKSLLRPAMKFIPPQQLIWLWFWGPCSLLVTRRTRTRYCSPVCQQKFCPEFRRKQSQPFSKGYVKGQLLDNCSLISEGAREEESSTEPATMFKWRFLKCTRWYKNHRGSNPWKIYWATWEHNITKSLLRQRRDPTKFGSDRLCFSIAPMPRLVASVFSTPFKT